eukprot:TRINITY_DN11346_c0_g1_i2.p1 TRINITY_DN11346_c0_g1~~TRINITY_DN11346_c0_g1_i2.p1  ORF type:complete len:820 (+),score=150.12 TRINITY_DN11346_c0_g1_i2:141-2462(+)
MAGMMFDEDKTISERLSQTVLHTFVRTNNAQLFGNVAMKTVLEFKWNTYARARFLRELVLFAAFLALYTVFTLIASRSTRFTDGLVSTMFGSFTGLLSCILALVLPCYSIRALNLEYKQFRRGALIYGDDPTVLHPADFWAVLLVLFDGWNLLQTASASLSLTSCVLFLLGWTAYFPIAAIAAYLTWIQVLYFLRAYELTGGLVRMVFKVFYYTGPFMMILLIVLLASANCFYVIFSDLDGQDAEAMVGADDSVLQVLFKTFRMLLLGDGAAPDGLPESRPALHAMVTLLFTLFMVSVNIFMLNLMINLLDDFMQRINDDEGDAFPFEQARIIAEIELTMSDTELAEVAYFPRWLHVLKPKGGETMSSTEDQWKGTVQAIRNENAHLEKRTRQTVLKLESDLKQHLALMEKHSQENLIGLGDKLNSQMEVMFARLRAEQFAMLQAVMADGNSPRSSLGGINGIPRQRLRPNRLDPTRHVGEGSSLRRAVQTRSKLSPRDSLDEARTPVPGMEDAVQPESPTKTVIKLAQAPPARAVPAIMTTSASDESIGSSGGIAPVLTRQNPTESLSPVIERRRRKLPTPGASPRATPSPSPGGSSTNLHASMQSSSPPSAQSRTTLQALDAEFRSGDYDPIQRLRTQSQTTTASSETRSVGSTFNRRHASQHQSSSYHARADLFNKASSESEDDGSTYSASRRSSFVSTFSSEPDTSGLNSPLSQPTSMDEASWSVLSDGLGQRRTSYDTSTDGMRLADVLANVGEMIENEDSTQQRSRI